MQPGVGSELASASRPPRVHTIDQAAQLSVGSGLALLLAYASCVVQLEVALAQRAWVASGPP